MRTASIVALSLLTAGLAWAGTPAPMANTSPDGALQTQTVYQYEYDHAGRIAARHGKVYDADSTLIGTVEVALQRDEAGRIVRSETVRSDVSGAVLWRMVETIRHDELGPFHKERTQWGADGSVVRHEVEVRHDQPGGASPVWQTDVYGPDGELDSVRFRTVDRDERGRILAQDISVFDAQGVQRNRVLSQWRYRKGALVARTRTTFDANDDIARVSRGHLEMSEGATTRWVWTDTDGRGTVLGRREVLETRDEAGHLLKRLETFRAADGTLVRTVTTEWTYDDAGRIEASRSHITVFDLPDTTP